MAGVANSCTQYEQEEISEEYLWQDSSKFREREKTERKKKKKKKKAAPSRVALGRVASVWFFQCLPDRIASVFSYESLHLPGSPLDV